MNIRHTIAPCILLTVSTAMSAHASPLWVADKSVHDVRKRAEPGVGASKEDPHHDLQGSTSAPSEVHQSVKETPAFLLHINKDSENTSFVAEPVKDDTSTDPRTATLNPSPSNEREPPNADRTAVHSSAATATREPPNADRANTHTTATPITSTSSSSSSAPITTTTTTSTTSRSSSSTTPSIKSATSDNGINTSVHATTTSKKVLPLTAALSAPSSQSTMSSDTADTTSVSPGAVAGVIVGIFAVIGAMAVFVAMRKKRMAKSRALAVKPDPFTMGFGSHDTPPHEKSSIHTPYSMTQAGHSIQSVLPTAHPSYTAESIQTARPISALSPMQEMRMSRPISAMTSGMVGVSASASTSAVGLSAMGAGTMAYDAAHEEQQMPMTSLGVFTVVSTYAPTLSDEIDIQPGDQVEVLAEYDDGWCQGINLSRGQARGVFPKHCLDYAMLPSEQQSSVSLGEKFDKSSKRVSSMYMSFQTQNK